jgi:type III secretory pathway component EscU
MAQEKEMAEEKEMETEKKVKKEKKKISVAEVRKTISTSLAAAFGFVIALLWNQVVQGGLGLVGINTQTPTGPIAYIFFLVTAIVITVVMIVFIILLSRWGGEE